LPGIRRLAAGWEARRLDAEEDLAEIDLRRGRPDQVLDRLHTLAAAHPRRPRLAAALARALAATGRIDQARTVLTQAERIAGRAGDRVHPALARAREALSRPGPDGGPPGARPGPVASATVVPFQLPADTIRFTGRTDHLARLLDLCAGEDRGAPANVVVTAVEGMAGIGKTALAVTPRTGWPIGSRTGCCSPTCAGSPPRPIRPARSRCWISCCAGSASPGRGYRRIRKPGSGCTAACSPTVGC
jgi:hypothetical protein